MTTATTPLADRFSPLDNPAIFDRFGEEPFFPETVTLLRSVRDHDFDTLADLCDDDFGIVDLDVDGSGVPIRSRAEWEDWFASLFAKLDAAGAETDSIITDYAATRTPYMGFGVLEWVQTLSMGPLEARFTCMATLVWKRTETGWKEARWHASLLSADIPPEMAAAA